MPGSSGSSVTFSFGPGFAGAGLAGVARTAGRLLIGRRLLDEGDLVLAAGSVGLRFERKFHAR